MTYYAIDDIVTQDKVDGCIEISDEKYAEAIDAKTRGLLVFVENGELVIREQPEPVEPDPVPEPTDYIISKATPWVRMTDAEAEAMQNVLATKATARQLGIYNAENYIVTNGVLYPIIYDLLLLAVGGKKKRVDELLAREQ